MAQFSSYLLSDSSSPLPYRATAPSIMLILIAPSMSPSPIANALTCSSRTVPGTSAPTLPSIPKATKYAYSMLQPPILAGSVAPRDAVILLSHIR